MRLDRREFLRLAGIAAGATISACTPIYAKLSGVPMPLASWVPEEETHFGALSRMTFGPRLEERLEVQQIGVRAWLEAQLVSRSADPSPGDPAAWRRRPLDALKLDADSLSNWESEEVVSQLKRGTLLSHVYSPRQLEELMVSFWTDHFNISIHKGDCWFLKVVDDREVVRRHAMGSFRDLLWASAHSPAMLVYLDNQVNHKDAPNENYARELMELHTLGVDGGYDQRDVMELARCFTGWTVKDRFWRGAFRFDPEAHDPGTKKVLGLRVEPAGQREAERILDHLAIHPSTARFVAVKLVRKFLDDHPRASAEGLVDRAAAVFMQTRGDITAMLRTVLHDGLLSDQAPGVKFKRPLEFLVSALRMLNADTDGGETLHKHLAEMGQGLFEWPTPEGPPDEAAAWAGGLLPRWKSALDLVWNAIPGTVISPQELLQTSGAQTPEGALQSMSALLLGAQLPDHTQRALLDAFENSGEISEADFASAILAGLLASPAFQWR